jgi:hypothetical protein
MDYPGAIQDRGAARDQLVKNLAVMADAQDPQANWLTDLQDNNIRLKVEKVTNTENGDYHVWYEPDPNMVVKDGFAVPGKTKGGTIHVVDTRLSDWNGSALRGGTKVPMKPGPPAEPGYFAPKEVPDAQTIHDLFKSPESMKTLIDTARDATAFERNGRVAPRKPSPGVESAGDGARGKLGTPPAAVKEGTANSGEQAPHCKTCDGQPPLEDGQPPPWEAPPPEQASPAAPKESAAASKVPKKEPTPAAGPQERQWPEGTKSVSRGGTHYHSQEKGNTCAIACTRMVIESTQLMDVPEDALTARAQEIGTYHARDGTRFEYLPKLLHDQGVTTSGPYAAGIEELAARASPSHPAIVKYQGHVAIVDGVTTLRNGTRVVNVRDPNPRAGPGQMYLDAFSSRYEGEAIFTDR